MQYINILKQKVFEKILDSILEILTGKQFNDAIKKIPDYYELIKLEKFKQAYILLKNQLNQIDDKKLQLKKSQINKINKIQKEIKQEYVSQKQNLKQQKLLQKQQKEEEEKLLQKQQKEEEEKIFKKIVKSQKKQNKKFKAYKDFKHTQKTVNNIQEHNIALEIPSHIGDDYIQLIDYNYDRILNILLDIQKNTNFPFKIKVFLIVETSDMLDGVIFYSTHKINTEFTPINDLNSQLANKLYNFYDAIDIKIQSLGKSNLQIERYLYLSIKAIQFQQQGVGSYIQLQGLLAHKQCCINIQNQDEQCAIYCFLYFYYTKVLNQKFKDYHRVNNNNFNYDEKKGILNVNSINKTQINKEFNIGNIKFPVNLPDIKKIAKGFGFTYSLFEHQSRIKNKQEIIEVRVIDNQREIEGIPHIDLLMIKQEVNDRINTHLLYIKDFNSLVHQSVKKRTKFYCKNCMNYFYKQDLLKNHQNYCYEKENPSTDKYPDIEEKIFFKSYQKQQQLPFLIIADTEALVKTIENQKEEEEIINEEDFIYNQKTKKIAKHEMVSYGFQIYDQYGKLDKHYYEYIQKDEKDNVAIKFIQEIYNIQKKIKKIIKETNVPFQMTRELQIMRQEATKCYICQKQFKDDDDKDFKVIDHNHFTGEVRGIAHNSCNLHYNLQKSKIPIIFHNLRSYDGHFIIKNISEFMKQNDLDIKIDCIANNSEKFMSITWGNVRFIDSIQFLPASLEILSGNLPINQKQITMKYLKERFNNKLSQEEIEGILNKGKFPYSWFNTLEKLEYQGLPNREAFYNDLTNKELEIREYNEAQELFQKLDFKTFRQWLLLYQTVDVLLLSDVWINFRDNCLKNYKLDPGHYYSSPGLSWEAMLKITDIQLDLISNPEIYMMFEKQSRGGISNSGNIRYSKANNKYCENYDKEKDNTYLLYVDANNLYGDSMMQKLPYRNFKFIKNLENYGEDFIKFYNNGTKGYVYDVDILYPENLHNQHNGYPLAPEQLIITHDMISQYNKDVINNLKTKEDIKIVMGNTKKLTPTLLDKKNYVCNIRNLQFYIQQGMKIQKINRIIEFDQKDFMRPYIELNTQLRQNAKNDFEKDFFKLMNNSVFGKTCENVRKRASYVLVSNEKIMRKVISSIYFKNYIKISENLALVEKHQKIVKLNKPSYIGMQVLDLSKITMYNYYYNHILKQNFKQVDLIMTDTDSLFLSITTQQGQDLYDNMIQNSDKYDFSNVTKGDIFDKIKQHCDEKQLDLKEFLNKNKAVVGKFKNEVPNNHIIEAVSIKSKCYDFITNDDKCYKKLKGIKKCVVKNDITHDDYKQCIFNQKVKIIEQKTLRSYNHEIFTLSLEKLALQSYNDKRYILQDGIQSLAYGHYQIKNSK